MFFYGLMYRPYAPGAVPAGSVEHGTMDKPPFEARKGWVAYATAPTPQDIRTFDLQPLAFDPRGR